MESKGVRTGVSFEAWQPPPGTTTLFFVSFLYFLGIVRLIPSGVEGTVTEIREKGGVRP